MTSQLWTPEDMKTDEPRRADLGLLIPSFRGGGAEGTTVRLANCLAGRGLAIDVVVLDPTGPWRGTLDPTIRLVALGVKHGRQSLRLLGAYMRDERPRAILVGPTHLSVAALAARRISEASTAILVLEHNDLRGRQRYRRSLGDRLLPWLVRWAYPRADILTAVSRGAADTLASILGKPAASVGVLYNGIDLPSIKRLAAEPVAHPWFSDDGPPVLLSVGRLVQQKGFDQLIRALALLRDRTPARLIILGEGGQRSRLEAMAQELGVGQEVALLGFHANPYAYMARATVFVLSSRFEGFGIVLAEALACGLPIVSTDCPSGPREILQDGRFGVLTPIEDPSALADALARLLADRERMATLRNLGPQRAQDFSVDRAADSVLSLLRGLQGPGDGSSSREPLYSSPPSPESGET